jgi:hypothetical protein
MTPSELRTAHKASAPPDRPAGALLIQILVCAVLGAGGVFSWIQWLQPAMSARSALSSASAKQTAAAMPLRTREAEEPPEEPGFLARLAARFIEGSGNPEFASPIFQDRLDPKSDKLFKTCLELNGWDWKQSNEFVSGDHDVVTKIVDCYVTVNPGRLCDRDQKADLVSMVAYYERLKNHKDDESPFNRTARALSDDKHAGWDGPLDEGVYPKLRRLVEQGYLTVEDLGRAASPRIKQALEGAKAETNICKGRETTSFKKAEPAGPKPPPTPDPIGDAVKMQRDHANYLSRARSMHDDTAAKLSKALIPVGVELCKPGRRGDLGYALWWYLSSYYGEYAFAVKQGLLSQAEFEQIWRNPIDGQLRGTALQRMEQGYITTKEIDSWREDWRVLFDAPKNGKLAC